jgi:putative glutamine amidotransferase
MMMNPQKAEEYAEMADGLIITGGESVHPRYYGETFENMARNNKTEIAAMKGGCNIPRDEYEIAAFEAFKARKKPILGICRGHQLINAVTGGRNMLNFPREHHYEHHMGISHEIDTDPNSFLAKLYGSRLTINSYHQDCAVEVGPDMFVGARSLDGIIESVQHKELPIFGVQFHPERMRGDNPIPAFGADGNKIFEYFLSLC